MQTQGTELSFPKGLGLTYDQVCLFRQAHFSADVVGCAMGICAQAIEFARHYIFGDM